MKKILLSLMFCCLSATMIFAQELITNGGFETWTVNEPLTNMPASWARGAGTVGTHYLYETDPVQNNVLRLKDNVGNAGAKRFNTTTNFSILTEGTYRVTFKVKGDVGLRFVALVKGTTSPSSSAQSATNHFTNITGYTSPTVVSDWTTVQTDIIVPSSATFGDDYRFHISWSHSTTTLYCDFLIDDVSIVKYAPSGNKLTTPTVGTASSITSSGFTANWTAVDNASSYDVQVYQGASLIQTTNFSGQATNTGSITGLSAGTTYTYKVVAKGDGESHSDSDPSNASAELTTLTEQLATPTLKKPNAVANSGFRAYWNAVANASSYDVKVFEGEIQVGSTQNTASTSLAITGLSANTSYTYRVTAKGTGGYTDSDESASSSAVTTLTADKDYVLSQYADTEVADLKADLIAGHSEIYELTTSGGAYQFTSTDANNITLTSSATIRALSGLANKPVISINNSSTTATSSIFAIDANDVTLTFEGLEFDGINANTTGTPIQNILVYGLANKINAKVIIRNCYIHDFKNAAANGTIRLDAAGSSMDIQGSAMRDCSGRVLNLYTATATYGAMVLKNSTFSNIGADGSASGGFLYYRSVSPNVAAGTTVTIEHCTFDTYTSSANEIFRINNAMSGLVSVKNSIFTNIVRGLSFNGDNGFVIDECYLAGFATAVTDGTNRTVTNTLATAPLYTNASSGDFTLTNISELICSNGYAAGNTYGAVLTPLTVTTVSAGSGASDIGFTANWSSKANATGYVVNVYKDGSKVKSTRVGDVTSTEITDLTPNTSYTYKVIAIGDATTYSSSVESDASAPISTSNIFNVTGTTSISTLTSKNTSSTINVAAGAHLTIDAASEVNSVTVASGGKLTVNAGLTGALTLESDANGTATILDNYETPTLNATVKQYVTAGRNWYMSAPLNSANVSVLNRGASVQYFDETSGTWEVASGTMTRGKGYIQVANSTQGSTGTVEFTGTTNSGDVPVTLTNNSGGGKGFNLVGNPYPSYLSWSAVAADNAAANMPTGTMWYRTINYNGKSAWAPNTSYSLDDVVYNGIRFYKATQAGTSAASGDGPTGGVGATGIVDGTAVWSYEGSVYIFATVNADGQATPSTVSNLIPPMQAFWVRSNGGTLTFKNAMRQHESVSNRLKAPGSSNALPFVRLSVSNGASVDEALIYASENASNTFDSYDAPKYFNTSGSNQAQIYTSAGTEKLAINALNSIEEATALSLGFVTETANSFDIRATEVNTADLHVILLDNHNANEFDLTNGDSYVFSTTSEVNDANRFTLIFRAPDTTTALEKNINKQVFVVTNASGQIEIHAPDNSNYIVFNAMGQKVTHGTTSSTTHTINNNLSSGMYVVKVNDITGKVIIK